jgi:hypothetical protein
MLVCETVKPPASLQAEMLFSGTPECFQFVLKYLRARDYTRERRRRNKAGIRIMQKAECRLMN